MSIQINALNKVVPQRLKIIAEQTIMPNMGTRGTRGVLKGLGKPGSLFRRMITPAQTSTNARRVPIEVRSPATLPGTKPANSPTKTKSMILLLYGVLNLGCKSEKTLGKSPSEDMV